MLFIDESGARRSKLQEQNREAFKKFHEANVKKAMEALKAYGLKNPEKCVDISSPEFSIKQFREAAYTVARRTREAQSETAFGQLLRAGVMQEFNNIYQAEEVTYDAVVKQTQSNKRQEFYSPLERVGFPKRTQAGESFNETDFKGLDIELVNVKFGMLLAVERELIDDDQTGQIVQRAQQMGQNARIHEEAYVWARLMGAAGSFDGEAIPVSVTYPTAYTNGVPGASGGIHGSGRGVNALGGTGYSAARLSQGTIQSGWKLAKKMLDQSGRPMVVKPGILAVSPQDIFFAEVLMGSAMNPSASSTQTADIGATGSINSINPIKNLAGVLCSRFIPDYGTLLIDPAKGFAFQRRDPTEIIQENPQSGPAFSQEIFRYKERSRWEADFIDPKFIINLNPSLASS